MSVVKVQGSYRCEQCDRDNYRVYKSGEYVGYAKRDEYGRWSAHRVTGNLSERVGHTGNQLLKTVTRHL